MHYLKNATCYLSSPIQYEPKDAINWRPGICKELADRFGINVYDPHADEKQKHADKIAAAAAAENYDEVERIAKQFTKKDLGKIDRSDFLIAFTPKGVCSVGVPCEIIHAIQLKKPVMIVSDTSKKDVSFWYYGNMKHRYIFGSWNDLYAYLKEVDEGKHFDNHRWHIVYKVV